METMGMSKKQWETKMEGLLREIKASEQAYIKLSRQGKYPQRESFFKQQAAQRTDFAKIFADELATVEDSDFVFDSREKPYIFDTVASTVANGDPSDIALDRLILQKEQELIEKYQEVLSYSYIPDATAAIVQAQAEDINNTILKLKVDLNLEEKAMDRMK